MPPIPDVSQIFRDHSIGQIDEALYRYPDVHIRSERTESRDRASAILEQMSDQNAVLNCRSENYADRVNRTDITILLQQS